MVDHYKAGDEFPDVGASLSEDGALIANAARQEAFAGISQRKNRIRHTFVIRRSWTRHMYDPKQPEVTTHESDPSDQAVFR